MKVKQAHCLVKSLLQGKVGALEGTGYEAKGLFRPMLDCLMFSRGIRPLCRVCQQAVGRTIRYYKKLFLVQGVAVEHIVLIIMVKELVKYL